MDQLQQFIYLRTYSRFLWEEGRREYFEESVDRYINWMFSDDRIPEKVKIKSREKFLNLDAVGSMRAFWTAGEAADDDNTVIYNCSGLVIDNLGAFGEVLYLLMCGAGVGFSCEMKHTDKLPPIIKQKKSPPRRHIIEDSRQGWKAAMDLAVETWWSGYDIYFDFSCLRPMGSPLRKMGGRSSGPDVLRQLLAFVRETVMAAQGRKLTPIECHDICCEIASVVIVGGTRRSALISISDLWDEDLRECKSNGYHGRRNGANNSAAYYAKPDMLDFLDEWVALAKSGTGERGIINLWGARRNAPHRRKSKPIQLSNPCKPLRSLILTPFGYRTFAQALSYQSLVVHTGGGETCAATKPFVSQRSAKIWSVELSNGTHLYGTNNHLHQLRDGQWKRMDELNVGDRLSAPYHPIYSLNPGVAISKDRDMGILAGWVWADGNINQDRIQLAIGNHEFDVTPTLERITGCQAVPHTQKPCTCRVITSKKDWTTELQAEGFSPDKSNLDWLYLKPAVFQWAFIQAAFTADGSVRKKNNVELYSIHRRALENLCHILRQFGIFSCVQLHNNAKSYKASDGLTRNNQTCWKLNVFAGQFTLIGFLSKFKNDLLAQQQLSGVYRYSDYLTVVSVTPNVTEEDVYDITVESDHHSFVDAGVVSHNCGEVSLRNKGLCNLSEVILRSGDDFESVRDKITTAVWLGVLQSTKTNFPHLSPEWAENANEERLCGVSLTGQFDTPSLLSREVLKLWRAHALNVARKASKALGINMPAAVTCVKPSGTVSKLVSSSAGIHPRWAARYIQHIQIAKTDPLFKCLADQGIPFFDTEGAEHTAVIPFPVASPDGAITRHDVTALDQLEWYLKVTEEWCEHNASATIYVRNDEWLNVANWVYDHFDRCNGLTFFPSGNENSYNWTPYQEITEEEYERRVKEFPKLDFNKLRDYEDTDETTGAKEFACAGGGCDL